MSKILLLISWLAWSLVAFLYPNSTFAQSSNCQISQEPHTLIRNVPPLSFEVPADQRWFKFRIVVGDQTANYKVVFQEGRAGIGAIERGGLTSDSEGVLRQTNNDLPGLQYAPTGTELFNPGTHNFYIEREGVSGRYCNGSYTIEPDVSGGIQSCNLTATPPDPDETQDITIDGTILPQENYGLKISSAGSYSIQLDVSGNITPINIGKLNPSTYEFIVQRRGGARGFDKDTNCRYRLIVTPAGQKGSFTQIGQPGPGGTAPTGTACVPPDCAEAGGKPCPDPPDPNNPGIQTAIGCIHTSPVALVKDFLKFGLGIGGGLAFLMMLLGAFQMLTSAGNPETLATGKDRLTNAVIGLLFVIFSVLLMQIIGFDILGIPGFGRQ